MQRRAVNSLGNYDAAFHMNTHELLGSDYDRLQFQHVLISAPRLVRRSQPVVSEDAKGHGQGTGLAVVSIIITFPEHSRSGIANRVYCLAENKTGN
jgi:hypothetical protein